MSLQSWLQSGWLKEHRSSRQEIQDLLAVADRDLHDCLTPGLSADWKLNIAYNAALQLAAAALHAAGYRPEREAHHFRTIQSLTLTIGVGPALLRQFELFRKKRNLVGYERAGVVSDQEAQEMIALAQDLRRIVGAWLHSEHPDLVGIE